MTEQNTTRIVLLGKYGAGSSSLANTIFGENCFKINNFSDSEIYSSQRKTRFVHKRSLTLIDTSGLFHPDRSEEDKTHSVLSCVTECAPGPHVFLIVFKVEKFTEQENAIATQFCELFSEDAFEFAAVVFTRGDQLPDGKIIQEFVRENKELSELVEKCGGRCYVFDNKYWKQNQQDEYRNNQFQVAELLQSVDKIVKMHNGHYYTNIMLVEVEREIKSEEEHIRQSSESRSERETREEAKRRVIKKRLERSKHPWFRWLKWFVVYVGIPGILVFVVAMIGSQFKKKALVQLGQIQAFEERIYDPD